MDEPNRAAYTGRRILQHVRWAREHGVGRLIEEDQLDPRDRARLAMTKWWWRRRHGVVAGQARPIWVVGVQRSGTNMLVRGLERAPEFEVRNENDRTAFERFRLVDGAALRLVERSRHRFVLFKPLCDSHRTPELLDGFGDGGRAIWAYRGVDGRVRSSLAKFGDTNLQVLRRIAAGEGDDLWQAQRLSDDSRALIERFDYDTMTPETAAALFWYVRNRLYFELGLDAREDVTLASYDTMVTEPERMMRHLCAFIGLDYRPSLVAHVDGRALAERPALAIDPEVRARCDELEARLARTLGGELAGTVGG